MVKILHARTLMSGVSNSNDFSYCRAFVTLVHELELPHDRLMPFSIGRDAILPYRQPQLIFPGEIRRSSCGYKLNELIRDPEILLLLLGFVLCETKVVLLSSHPGVLYGLSHVIHALLYPMYWPHCALPILPPSMLHYLKAPIPFLFGVCGPAPSLLNDVWPQLKNVLVLDWDEQVLLCSTLDQEIPLLVRPHSKLSPGHSQNRIPMARLIQPRPSSLSYSSSSVQILLENLHLCWKSDTTSKDCWNRIQHHVSKWMVSIFDASSSSQDFEFLARVQQTTLFHTFRTNDVAISRHVSNMNTVERRVPSFYSILEEHSASRHQGLGSSIESKLSSIQHIVMGQMYVFLDFWWTAEF